MTQEGSQGEGALTGRLVTVITPFFTLFAGWLAGVVANAMPGVKLDRGQIVAFMIAASTATLSTGLKWLHGWQQHEQNVADGKVPPIVTRDAPLKQRLAGTRPVAQSTVAAGPALRARAPRSPRRPSQAGRSG